MTDQTTILYIEDDEPSRTLVQRLLSHAGYQVVTASRALEGLDLARKHRPGLILVDINLPDMSGREVALRLRADPQLAGVPIVALTAQSQVPERNKTFAAGVTGYITKPVDVETLADRVAAYLSGHRESVDVASLEVARDAYSQELVERLEANVRELEMTNRNLMRVDRIKDDFIQLTAHELRTPLTTVYGYSQLVQSSPHIQYAMAQNAEIRLLLQGLVDSIDRLHVVINEIVTVSRIASGRVDLKLGPTDLKDVLHRAVSGYAQVLQQRMLTLTFSTENYPAKFFADESLLELAFSNIFSNAIKYTPDGGRIVIAVQTDEKLVHVSVKDTGIGIDPVDQRYIFERFYTAGDTQLHSTSKTAFRGGGLGLGLAISQGIVLAHNGKIWVESDGLDEQRLPGSTFFVALPLDLYVSSPVPDPD